MNLVEKLSWWCKHVDPSRNHAIHQRAISVLRNLLYNHDLDVRYTDPEVKSRLAALYLPVIGIVIDALPQVSTIHVLDKDGLSWYK